MISTVLILLFCLCGISMNGLAQDTSEKVDWHHSIYRDDNNYQLVFDAFLLETDWHFWDVNLESDFLIPTQFIIQDSSDYVFNTELLVDGKTATIHDPDFGELKYYESDMRFTINFSPKNDNIDKIVVSIIYQACNKTLCQPPQKLNFEIFLNK